MQNLYSFYCDCGRSGSLDGLFIATPEQVAQSIGKEAYFGEVLGKHSEVYGTIDEGEIRLVSDDQDKVQWLKSLTGANVSGFNPLDYISSDQ